MSLRNLQSEPGEPVPSESGDGGTRLNLLISYGGWRPDDPLEQLPRLLEPLGVRSIRAGSGDEAADVIRQQNVHIAVVDLDIPFDRACNVNTPGGARILQMLRRLGQPPPTVVVRPPQCSSRESQRSLSAALQEGAFAVLDQPLRLETLLEVMRRILRRHYSDVWPNTSQN